jgi:hypothetical protein
MLLEGEAENLTRKSVELALNGDIHALLLRLDRIIPPRREQALQGKWNGGLNKNAESDSHSNAEGWGICEAASMRKVLRC